MLLLLLQFLELFLREVLGVGSLLEVRNLSCRLFRFSLRGTAVAVDAVAAGRDCLLREVLEAVLDGFILRLHLTLVHGIDERHRGEEAIEAVADHLRQVQVSLTLLLLDDAVDHVFGRAEENLTLQHHFNVLETSHHLQLLD